MGRYLCAALAGILFGAGLAISGMVNPMKVLNFLDLAGAWDPTLIIVMGAGLVITFLGYRLVLARKAPLFDSSFQLPATQMIDGRLIGGGVLFGLGWGLAGFCPAPAIGSLVFGYTQSWIFVAAMAVGALLVRIVQHHAPTSKELADVEG